MLNNLWKRIIMVEVDLKNKKMDEKVIVDRGV